MKYSIIGSGEIGSALAKKFAQNRIKVAIANTRGPDSLTSLANELGDSVIPKLLADAIKSELIILAVPFSSLGSIAQEQSDWNGKIVIDTMNAFGVPLEVLGDSSSSGLVTRALPGARVVKAFNHLPSAILASNPIGNGGRRVVFISSDDHEASSFVANLAKQLGFAPIELGSLATGSALLDVRGPKLGPLLLQNLIQIPS